MSGLRVAKEAGRMGGRKSAISDEDVLAMANLTPRSAMKRTGLTRTGWLRRLEGGAKRAAEKPV